jgi:tripartite-type tricarboxylate transporter receptor subunit TctC
MPELPTIAESGYPGYEAITWYGAFAPAGTRLRNQPTARRIQQSTQQCRIQKLAIQSGADAAHPDELMAQVKRELNCTRL